MKIEVSRITKSFSLKSLLAFLFLVLVSNKTLAQNQGILGSNEVIIVTILVLLLIFFILILFYLIFVMLTLRQALQKQDAEPGAVEVSLWDELKAKITGLIPLEQEENIKLDHNYDGIQELDNHLPPWWTYLFYITIIFGFVYVLVYHVFDTAPLQEEEYLIEMEVAAKKAEERKLLAGVGIDETNVEATDAPAELDNGQNIFEGKCAACHQNDGGGGVGPNLTDQYWINGGGIKDLFSVIKYGVTEKGMISWQSQLSPSDMRDVSSYILTMQGTQPANPKAPQGELYQP